MDSVKTVGVNFFSLGVWWIDIIPFALQTIIGCLTIYYLLLKINHIKKG